jgi:hypothetical protein
VGFDGAGNERLLGIIHETIEEDKGPKLAFKCFRSLPLIDEEDVEVNPLHMIFDLIGVLIGRDYFKINHLLPPPFNFFWGCTLLGINVVPRLGLKEFLLRCLE